MSQKLLLKYFKWVEDVSELNEDFIKCYSDGSDERYFLEVDVQYPENLHNLYYGLSLLPKRIKIKKVDKLLGNLHDNEEYILHIRNFKKALNYKLVFEKVHRVIKFKQKSWSKQYIDKNTDLRKKSKSGFKKDFF